MKITMDNALAVFMTIYLIFIYIWLIALQKILGGKWC